MAGCAPRGPEPKRGSPILFPSAPPQEGSLDVQGPPGMPKWLVGKLDPNQIAWAENTYQGEVSLPDMPNVAVTSEQILLDGDVVAATQQAGQRPWKEYLGPLFYSLVARRNAWRAAHPCKPFPGAVAFWIDDRTQAQLVNNAILGATFAGFPNVHLVVRDRSNAGFGVIYFDNRAPLSQNKSVACTQQDEVFARNREAFEKCNGPRTGRESEPQAYMTMHYTINADGSVSGIRFECDAEADPAMRQCIADVVSKLRFPPPANAPTNNSRSFLFDPK